MTPAETTELLSELAEKIDPDNYSQDGTVAQLESRFAQMLGKEAAIFMPTGTMANHLAVRALCAGRGTRVIAQANSHLVNDAGDCAQVLSGLNPVSLAQGKPFFSGADIADFIARTQDSKVAVSVAAVAVESPVRRLHNVAASFADLQDISTTARAAGLGLHLDGARLPLYCAHLGVEPKEVAALFDTVYVSLYKCYSAPAGAILAGPANIIDDLFHTRRMFGGGLLAVWPYAAIALHHFENFAEDSKQVFAMAEAFFKKLADDGRCEVTRIASGTNGFHLKPATTDPANWRAKLKTQNIELPEPINGSFPCRMNPTWLRTTADELATALLAEL